MRYLFLGVCPLFCLFAEEMIVNLQNPAYQHGVLYTEEGGIVQGEQLRVQARSIRYTKRREKEREIHQIEAKKDLVLQYKDRVFVGSELFYDCTTQTGILYDGVTSSSVFFVRGEEIHIAPHGNYEVKNVAITTSEMVGSTWDLHAKNVEVEKELFAAEKIRLRVGKIPIFALPSFKVNWKRLHDPLFRYTLDWDKGQGPRGQVRYQLYSWQDFALYGRLEYRWKTGFGGAIETDYVSPSGRTKWVTKSYLGSDRLQTAPEKERRYRLQGALHSRSGSNKTDVKLTWDKYNDVRMPSLFTPDDFEVSTAKRTLFFVDHQEASFLASLHLRVKVNPFESVRQDLPTLYFQALPHALGNTGIYQFFSTKVGLTNFSYSSQLVSSIQNFRAFRGEIGETLQRPTKVGPCTLTPFLGGRYIFYSDSPDSSVQNLLFATYGATASLTGTRHFSSGSHIVSPFASFTGITHPTVSPDAHYIFSINDGYNKIEQMQVGVKNTFSFPHSTSLCSLYGNAFFSESVLPHWIPRLYLDWETLWPSCRISWKNCWNFQNHVLDFSKFRLLWTLSENSALSFEARYRSQFDWRKADRENWILDVTRSQEELLASPLSDRRITFLFSGFFRINPLWDCKISCIQGFFRIDEDPYTEAKVDLSRWINPACKVRLSYSHIRNDDRVSLHFDLVKK